MRIVPLSDGDPSFPTLVCLPGAMCSPLVFKEAAQESGLRAIALAWLEDDGSYDLDAIARRILSAISDQPRVVLVGHSLGTPLAVLAALSDLEQESPRVRGLLLANSGANTRGHADAQSLVKRIENDWGVAMWASFLERCFRQLPGQPLLDELRSYPSRLRKEAVSAAIRSQLQTDLLPVLARLEGLPTIVVHGKFDAARTLWHAQELAGAIPGATLRVLDTGHTSCVENPAAFAALMREVGLRCTAGQA